MDHLGFLIGEHLEYLQVRIRMRRTTNETGSRFASSQLIRSVISSAYYIPSFVQHTRGCQEQCAVCSQPDKFCVHIRDSGRQRFIRTTAHAGQLALDLAAGTIRFIETKCASFNSNQFYWPQSIC